MQDESIPYGFCKCGCGEKTSISSVTIPNRGMIRGEPKRFVRGHSTRIYRHMKAPLLEVGTRKFVCAWCAYSFERPHKPGRPAKYCGTICAEDANRARAVQWYRSNPERARLQPSRQPDVRREKNVEYYAANREREIERALAYSRGPGRDAKRALDAARYALTRGASSAERFTLDDIFVRDAGICHLCGDLVERHGLGSLSATMDHVIPVTKGGHHTLENVKLAHRSCNTRKGNKLLL